MLSLVAIDPGGHGYAVRLTVHHDPLSITIEDSFSLTSYREMDYKAFDQWCLWNALESSLAVIEHPFPKSRGIGRGLLTQGINYGYAHGLILKNFKHTEIISPSDWKCVFNLNKKDSTDRDAINLAAALVGHDTLIPPRARTPNMGLVDAILIGYYGYLNFINED